MTISDTTKHSRRAFLGAAAASLTLAACTRNDEEHFSEAQRSRRRQGESTVAVVRCQSYDRDIWSLIKPHVLELGLPDLTGKHVVLKPNMVEYRKDKPVHTNPAMIEAAAQLVDHLGAGQITVAEGPGHFRDTEFLLSATGIGKICSQLGLPFVDLNLDEVDLLPNPAGLTELKHFVLPKTILTADAVVSLPKMKTHHWVGVTASMKNLFGTVPGRKYGWPKNLLHFQGIERSIIDLVHLVSPVFALVDGIVAMEGDGPINGVAKESGIVVLGNDLAAVDATCARAMGLDPKNLTYMRMAGELVGNIDSQKIKVIGTPLDEVRQSFVMPVTFSDPKLAGSPGQQGS